MSEVGDRQRLILLGVVVLVVVIGFLAWNAGLFTPSDPTAMTVEQLDREIDKVTEQLREARRAVDLNNPGTFNQSWNQYLDKQQKVYDLEARLNELRSERSMRRSSGAR